MGHHERNPNTSVAQLIPQVRECSKRTLRGVGKEHEIDGVIIVWLRTLAAQDAQLVHCRDGARLLLPVLQDRKFQNIVPIGE